MTDEAGNWITHNGEIYNYIELRDSCRQRSLPTSSDTEVILRAYRKWGMECVNHLRGMFSFALWDEASSACSALGTASGSSRSTTPSRRPVPCASEVKALLPFVARIQTDLMGWPTT